MKRKIVCLFSVLMFAMSPFNAKKHIEINIYDADLDILKRHKLPLTVNKLLEGIEINFNEGEYIVEIANDWNFEVTKVVKDGRLCIVVLSEYEVVGVDKLLIFDKKGLYVSNNFDNQIGRYDFVYSSINFDSCKMRIVYMEDKKTDTLLLHKCRQGRITMSGIYKGSDLEASMVNYYHADHLGSATWITDGNGDLVEHRRYLPYGEEWYAKNFVEDRYTERFRFTGKERDAESGYDYFGARYLDAMLLTSWLSVDKMWWKHQNESPYLYCAGNPIKNYDPDGNEKYNYLNPKGKDANLHIASNNYVDNVPAIHIWAHGTENTIKLYDKSSGQSPELNADQFASFLEGNVFPVSEAWQKHLEEGTQAAIVLHSCNTGEGDNSLAQQISEKLENTIVIAPSTTVAVNKDTKQEMGAYSTKNTTSNGKMKITTDKEGLWRVFRGGEEITNFSGSTKPNVSNPATYQKNNNE